MSKQQAIRTVVDEQRALGWTFVAARDRVQCQHYAMQDQAMTRRNPVWPGDAALEIACIGMRVENLP